MKLNVLKYVETGEMISSIPKPHDSTSYYSPLTIRIPRIMTEAPSILLVRQSRPVLRPLEPIFS